MSRCYHLYLKLFRQVLEDSPELSLGRRMEETLRLLDDDDRCHLRGGAGRLTDLAGAEQREQNEGPISCPTAPFVDSHLSLPVTECEVKGQIVELIGAHRQARVVLRLKATEKCT